MALGNTVRDIDAMFAACESGDLEALQHLMRKGVNVNEADMLGKQPIHYASEHGQTVAVQCLVQFGAAVDACDKNGMQPIHLASIEGHTAPGGFIN